MLLYRKKDVEKEINKNYLPQGFGLHPSYINPEICRRDFYSICQETASKFARSAHQLSKKNWIPWQGML